MEPADDDDDLKLVKASATLLADLQDALLKILWKRPRDGSTRGKVHSRVKQQDLEYVIKLLEPFQGEPQLLDAKLKDILPPLVDAYLQFIQIGTIPGAGDHVAFETAVCILFYTICKVRGYKIVLQFLSNEPRYLEPILSRLETVLKDEGESPAWQVSYVLLLWLSHLVLTPFDLASLSGPASKDDVLGGLLKLPTRLPSIAERVMLIALEQLCVSTKAQDAAALLLVRFVMRPDMQKLAVADAAVAKMLQVLQPGTSSEPVAIYEHLGPLRFLAGVCTAPELSSLAPSIYQACQRLVEDEDSPILANAVAKKLVVKIFRNLAILSLRPLPAQSILQEFSESTDLLENVIDHSLRSLGDRDTPVRYAAAKALSMIILQLEPEMGHEVIQAVLDSFQEDLHQRGDELDFRDANALKWHGLTLALAHTLFKRSASPDQLSDIVKVLVAALQFEQRTATGSSMGTNVRDAANFGIWALSRRYTTQELASVSVLGLPGLDISQDPKHVSQYLLSHGSQSVIQYLAIQLILSACLDPAGNIRRGSSAALQELIGRHPNKVYEGIALVQIVDYQAVGLRRRAMLDVANRAAGLHLTYWTFITTAIFRWRGFASSDVSSREAAAASLARLSLSMDGQNVVLTQLLKKLDDMHADNSDTMHGLVLALAYICEESDLPTSNSHSAFSHTQSSPLNPLTTCKLLDKLIVASSEFSLRLLKSELPTATIRLLAALCVYLISLSGSEIGLPWNDVDDKIESLAERMLNRHEDTILQVIPSLVMPFLTRKQQIKRSLGCLEVETLCKQIRLDSTKSTLHGAGRAIALGRLASRYNDIGSLVGADAAAAVTALGELMTVSNVDWRIIGVKAMQEVIHGTLSNWKDAEPHIVDHLVLAAHRAMNDYTIDERGDVGSLVRLQGINCTSILFSTASPRWKTERFELLQADIHRLSLEKLDRVRLAAAQCLHEHLDLLLKPTDPASVSSRAYFEAILQPLTNDEITWKQQAILEGIISSAGLSSEPLLQASRASLSHLLHHQLDTLKLHNLLSLLAIILKTKLTEDSSNNSMPAALELLAFLLDMQIPQTPSHHSSLHFKWRNLLSTVQKAHHKSNDIPRILAAVHVYAGLADIPAIRVEVLKKLVGMLKTNPYPRVRLRVAETLFVVTKDAGLKGRDWLKPASQNVETVAAVEKKFVVQAMGSIQSG